MRLIATTCLFVCFFLTTTAAQTVDPPDTREESLHQQREEKSRNTRPNKLDPVQRVLGVIEDRGMFLTARDGVFARLGGLATGSGLALGGGYRTRSIFDRYGTLEVRGSTSVKRYWLVEARATFPSLAHGRLFAEALTNLRELPQEKFFGLGPDTQNDDETTYLMRSSRAGGRGGVHLGPFVSLGGSLDYLTTDVGRGRNEDVPSSTEQFSPADIPGLEGGANFVRSGVFAEFDYRQPMNPRQGGFYRIERNHYADRYTGRYTFNRTDVDLRQYLGFLNGRRVIALRGAYSTTDVADGHEVPFYYMPWLGGRDTLRGFKNYRFRGLHSLLLQAEYRWEIWSALEGALFFDTGKVAMTRSEIALSNLQHSYGIGFRFNTNNGVVLRFDIGFARGEGKRLHMNAGGVF